MGAPLPVGSASLLSSPYGTLCPALPHCDNDEGHGVRGPCFFPLGLKLPAMSLKPFMWQCPGPPWQTPQNWRLQEHKCSPVLDPEVRGQDLQAGSS